MFIPKPLETNGIELSEKIQELSELLVKNTHDVRAIGRTNDG